MKSDKKPTRDLSLDYLKCFAMFLVCQTHYKHFSSGILDNLLGILSSSGVPLFFMVNGALLMKKPLADSSRHYKKSLRLFTQGIIWKAITIAVMSVSWHKSAFANGIKPYLNYLLGANTLEGFEAGHFWYIYALVGIYVIFPVLSYCCWAGNKGREALRIFFFIELFFSMGIPTWNLCVDVLNHYTGIEVPFDLNSIAIYHIMGTYSGCLIWFLLGFYVINHPAGLKTAAAQILIGWGLLFLTNRYQLSIGIEANGRVENAYYIFPTILLTCGMFSMAVRLRDRLPELRIVEKISKNTWGIYMLHMLTGIVFLKVQAVLHFSPGILLNTVKALWMLLASLGLTLILKKIPLVQKLF